VKGLQLGAVDYVSKPFQAEEVIAWVNTHLCKVNKESFVTALYAVYDPNRLILRIAWAARPLPILFRPAEGKAREVP
jgi:sigma-B regulation protein RsbU (phosphoserine phosphatase)